MATRTVRPKIQNGPVQRRSSKLSGSPSGRPSGGKVAPRNATVKSRSKTEPRRKKKPESKGDSRIYWLLVVLAAVMATGFIYSVRARINIHRLGQMESRLKSELDEIANQQRYEVLEQQRAINPQMSEEVARQSGLIQPELSGPRFVPAAETANRKPAIETGARKAVARSNRAGRVAGPVKVASRPVRRSRTR